MKSVLTTWRGSSVVEQWTENPCVGSSILPRATSEYMKFPEGGFFIFIIFIQKIFKKMKEKIILRVLLIDLCFSLT